MYFCLAQELRIEEPKVPRKKLKPSRFFEKKEGSDSPETAKQHYEKMFIAAFEKNIECLENRFNQRKNFYAVPEWNKLWLIRNDFMTGKFRILEKFRNSRPKAWDFEILIG